MANGSGPDKTKEQLVADYKALLRTYVDRRPSGTRLKIAQALGKHKSFVSQITNPAYSVPVPAQHLSTILEICHFSPEERDTFLAAYGAAHPNQRVTVRPRPKAAASQVIQIELPAFDDADTQREVEETIRQLASRVIGLALKR